MLSFKIDSLSCFCHGELEGLDSWTDRVLYHFGPDILVYGRLINSGSAPIILELDEYIDSVDTLINHVTFQRYFSFHSDGEDYCFAQNPLIVTDIFSFPYWDRVSLPWSVIEINGVKYLYSIIRPGESITLAFESLSKPVKAICELGEIDPSNSSAYRDNHQLQKRVVDSIASTITIIPEVLHKDSTAFLIQRYLFVDELQPEPIRVIIYSESRKTSRFIPLGPVMFKAAALNGKTIQKNTITDKSRMKSIVELVELGKTSGNPKKAPMDSIGHHELTTDIVVYTKDYPSIDTYALIEIIYSNRVETVALSDFKSNGCYYVEEEILTDDVGLYDYLANQIIQNW